MAQLKRNVFLVGKKVAHLGRSVHISRRALVEGVPYYSQWESPNLVRQIIEKKISATEDPLWKNSGAKTKEEYAEWSWNGCGMACLKMVLAHRDSKIIPLVMLGKKCAEYGGYTLPVGESHGLMYRPFVKFVNSEYGIEAKALPAMTLKDVLRYLTSGKFVIPSVSPQIREPYAKPKQKGGHLVLLLGYDLGKKELYFHNPSGFTKESQVYAAVSFKDFKKFFAGRAIVIDRK